MYPSFPSAITPPLASHQTNQLSLPNYYYYQAIAPRRIIRSSYLLLGPSSPVPLFIIRLSCLQFETSFSFSLSLRTESKRWEVSQSFFFLQSPFKADCAMELCDNAGSDPSRLIILVPYILQCSKAEVYCG